MLARGSFALGGSGGGGGGVGARPLAGVWGCSRPHCKKGALGSGARVQLYVCGPTPMMRAVARLAESHGRPCDVSLEQVMGCGLGGCYSCVVLAREPGSAPHFVRSCIDGPVFDSRRIVWDALAH